MIFDRLSYNLIRPLLQTAVLLVAFALLWAGTESIVLSLVWLAAAGIAIRWDSLGRRRFFLIVFAASLMGAAWSAALGAARSAADRTGNKPDWVAWRRLLDVEPYLSSLARPIVIPVFCWVLIACIVIGLVHGIGRRSWRQCFYVFVAGVAAFGIFVVLMAEPQRVPTLPPPLGIDRILLTEIPQAWDGLAPKAAPPDVEFDRMAGLSYGPHQYRNTLDLYIPRKRADHTPVVVYIHGGGIGQGGLDHSDLGIPRTWLQALLARGLAVAEINYRLVWANPGSLHEEVTGPFPAQIQDCLAAVRFLRKKSDAYQLDPDRVGVMGHSFGGFLASLVGLASDQSEFITETNADQSNRVQAVVVSSAWTDLQILHEQNALNLKIWNVANADYRVGDPNASFFFNSLFGGRVDRRSDIVWKASPVAYVRPSAPPFLLVYGFRDTNPPPHQGEILHCRLREVGAPSQFQLIPGAGHGLDAVPGTGELMAEFLREKLAR